MSALMSDVIEGNITPVVSNAAVNAGGKLLKVVEMQLRHGTSEGSDCGKILPLCRPIVKEAIASDPLSEKIAMMEDELAEMKRQAKKSA